MTKTKQMFCCLAAIIAINLKAQIKINPTFFSGNLWFTNYQGAPLDNLNIQPLNATEISLLAETEMKFIRQGGKNFNRHEDDFSAPHYAGDAKSPDLNPEGYIKIVDDMRANGFEPVITIPVHDDEKRSVNAQADTAARIVHLLNVVHKRNVKYFIIGNEPGIDQKYYNSDGTGTHDAEVMRIRDFVKFYSVKMKLIDPSI